MSVLRVLLFTLLFLPALLLAQTACTVAEGELAPPSEVTAIDVWVHVINIQSVNDAEQSYTADFIVEYNWNDPSLAAQSGVCVYALNEIWHPALLVFNQQRVQTTMPETVQVQTNGDVSYIQRYYGNFSTDLDLSRFPSDRQRLTLDFVSFENLAENLELYMEGQVSRADRFTIKDWTIEGFSIDAAPLTIRDPGGFGVDAEDVAKVSLLIDVERKLSFYLAKLALPLLIVVLMSWVVFFVTPMHRAQFSIATTAVLASIAYLYILNQIQPRVPHLTLADAFVLISVATVFLAFAVTSIINVAALNGREALAVSISRVARFAFPLTYLLANLLLLSF